MTLQAALATTRKVRLGTTGSFKSRDELTATLAAYTVDQIVGDGWIAEPTSVTLSQAAFAAHWDAVRSGFDSVKASNESRLFAALVARIYGS